MDMLDWHGVAGILAGIVSVLAYIPNTRATLARTNEQKLSSWIIWTSTSLLLLFSCSRLGISLGVPIAYFVGNLVTLAALICKKVPARWGLADTLSMWAAGLCLVPWFFFDAPVVTTTALLAMDIAGAWPTLRKVIDRPRTENRAAWALWGAGYALNLLAVRELTYTQLVYPVMLAVACGSISVLVLWPRKARM